MTRVLKAAEWSFILDSIHAGKCVPFIGAGAHAGVLPSAATIARQWADTHECPLAEPDRSNLAKVAEYLEVMVGTRWPKEQLALYLKTCIDNAVTSGKTFPVLDALAQLPFPIYITTNYDDLIVRALRREGWQPFEARLDWVGLGRTLGVSYWPRPDFTYSPSIDYPLVYFLHGHFSRWESMVLTERDYLSVVQSLFVPENWQRAIPPEIQEAFADCLLLFIGYRLADFDVRLILDSLIAHAGPNRPDEDDRIGYCVQHPEENVPMEYLGRYFDRLRIGTCWMDACEFATELRRRYEEKYGRKRSSAS